MKSVSRNDVARQVKILELVEKFDIKIESVSAGNFDYKCRCPSPDHKMGNEKTSSCYINSRDNNFFCYGCNKGVSSIDFYMFCTGKTFSEAMNELKELVKSPGTYQDSVIKKRAVFPLLVESSEIIRNFLLENPKSMKDIDEFLKKVDQVSFDESKEDADRIESMNKKIKEILG
jgi:DNA primase